MVANRHLPYEATLSANFAHVRVLADAHGFKAFEAVR
jgi:16S rRNA (guanine1207-N2)-methyltransferase